MGIACFYTPQRAYRRVADLSLDNFRDHRVRTIDLPFQKHAQAGLRVHRIVIQRFFRLEFPVEHWNASKHS